MNHNYITNALASRCFEVFTKASNDLGNDLRGFSVLDLCADNIDASLSELRKAIKASGISAIASDRIKSAISTY